MTYAGLLSSAHARDSIRVTLAIEEDVLHATEPGGTTWDIALHRVELIRWSDRELHLELAGEAVTFVPEHPEQVLEVLVPMLLARRQDEPKGEQADLPAGVTAPPLVVDLTESDADTERLPQPAAPPASVAPVEHLPAAPWPPEPSPAIAPAAGRRGRFRPAVAWALAAVAVATITLIVFAAGSDTGPEDRAQAALEAAGLPSVAVVVDGGIATLTGTVEMAAQREAAEAAVRQVADIDAIINQIATATTGPQEDLDAPPAETADLLAGDAADALRAAGIESAAIAIAGDRVVVSGSVVSEAERRVATAALLAVEGIARVDNQLTVTPLPDETVAGAARTALDEAGFDAVSVVIEDGVATLTGVVPLDALADGFFRYSDQAETTVVAQTGVRGVRNRLQLTGDAATLRDQLRSLTESAPITFALGDATLTATARATLDTASEIIQAQPGLRVLIAGHTDTTGSAGFNELLSQERADAVRDYLIGRGIASNRLVIVAYGELFPTTPGAAPLDRRVEFEVAG